MLVSSIESEEMQESGSNKTNIIAGVMVIGSLIAGLLFALLFFRRGKVKGKCILQLF